MAYVNPESVESPKGRVSNVNVVYDKGPMDGSWSIARLKWDGSDAVGIRWNGDSNQPGNGTPQSRGNATWFIVPDEIVDAVVSAATALERQKANDLINEYRAMAADEDREDEAEEWSEALIGDGFASR